MAPPSPPVAANPDSIEPPGEEAPLLRVEDLRVHFEIRGGLLGRATGVRKAVDGVSFTLHTGQTLGLVGESGCGKTTVGRAILGLIPATAGRVRFDGADVLSASGAALKALRRDMQIVFQDPAGSVNPRMRVLDIVAEPLIVHGLVEPGQHEKLRHEVEGLLERCGMPRHCVDRYPHEFSGGQRQRICIARALALRPRFLICDEPTSALDVSVQAQILNLLRDLQTSASDVRMSYLFISHDMGVINHMCDHIAVMHRGVIVEHGPRDRIIHEPRHEYTRTLLAAVPVADPARRTHARQAVPGAIAGPALRVPGGMS